MQDRPRVDELIEAVEDFLRGDVLPRSEGRSRYHLRVALNLLNIVRRELAHGPRHQRREWDGLRELGAVSRDPADYATALRSANDRLCAAIRDGQYGAEGPRENLLAHLRRVVADKLRVANPGFLERVLGQGAPDPPD
jgi:hypothetical protein